MRKFLLSGFLALLVAVIPAHAQITVPNTLAAGAVIRAAELNTNFSTIADKALNRITGGSIEGNITLLSNVTFDGVDISDFLLTTGEVRSQTAGTVAAPSFSRSGDTGTGIYFPTTSELGFALGGVQVFRAHASGITAYGVNIIDANGKIPALSSTYIANLSGANLTALNATQLTTGTVADARLSANVPLIDAGTNAFTGAATIGSTLGVTGTSTLGTLSAGATTVTSFTMATGATDGYILTTNGSGVGTWQSAGVATGAVPSGLIAIFDTACPSTWTRHTAFDNKFIRGGATYSAAAGGSDAHTHTVDPAAVTSVAGGSHSHTVDPTSTASTAAGSHDHGAATGGGGSHSHLSSGGTSFAGDHTHTGTTDNAGDHSHGGSSSAVGGSGGATEFITNIAEGGDHNHSFSTTENGDHEHDITNLPSDTEAAHTHSITTATDHTHNVDIASTASSTASDHTHSVDVASTATSSGANVPAYSQVVFCKKD